MLNSRFVEDVQWVGELEQAGVWSMLKLKAVSDAKAVLCLYCSSVALRGFHGVRGRRPFNERR
jgi:hypothetical protein